MKAEITKPITNTNQLAGRWTAKSLLPFVLLYSKEEGNEPDFNYPIIFYDEDKREWFKGVFAGEGEFMTWSEEKWKMESHDNVTHYFYAGGENEN